MIKFITLETELKEGMKVFNFIGRQTDAITGVVTKIKNGWCTIESRESGPIFGSRFYSIKTRFKIKNGYISNWHIYDDICELVHHLEEEQESYKYYVD